MDHARKNALTLCVRAVTSMAESPLSLRERARDAYAYALTHLNEAVFFETRQGALRLVATDGRDVGPALAGTLRELRERITAVAAKGDEGGIAATMAAANDDEVKAIVALEIKVIESVIYGLLDAPD